MSRFTSGISECTRPEIDVRERGKPHWPDSLCFSGHFPRESGLAGVYWSKGWWMWWWQLEYWSYNSRKAQVKSFGHQQTNIRFLQAGCPSCRPTNSVRAHLEVFQLCLWPL